MKGMLYEVRYLKSSEDMILALKCEDHIFTRFHVAVRLFSNRSQRTSKCGKNISATFLLLPHVEVICDLLLNRRTATWNVFVKLLINLRHSMLCCGS